MSTKKMEKKSMKRDETMEICGKGLERKKPFLGVLRKS